MWTPQHGMCVTAIGYRNIRFLRVLHNRAEIPRDGSMASSSILYLVINDRGDILGFCLTPGNVDDCNRKVMKHLTKHLFGKLFADKGYISRKLFMELLEKGVELITKQKKNAKNPCMLCFTDKLLLRKRAVIESVNDFLKNICQIEHSRNRSRCNFVVNLVAGLCAYCFLPKKPSIYTGNMTFA